MKKNLLAIALIAGVVSLSSFTVKAEINQKVLQSFHAVFAEAKHVKWTEYPDSYFVSFTQNDILVKVTYDKDGNLLSSIRYYKEQRLPLNILYKVKKEYPSKTIDIVTEVSNSDGTVYFVQLKDDKGWISVKSDESGNMEVVDRIEKRD
ncbi:MAG: hypothetical protein JST87_08935 [Bacteroidetes bacterium]|nr:hypothetical protein [Bacteroidota bacterium]MBS1933431.1 hypothetical protein [Bacteroidota bacterium]